MNRLKVWANEIALGWLGHEDGDYFFQYDSEWLQSDLKFVISPQFNLRPEPFKGAAVQTFFANLLPEGAVLDEIMQALQMRKGSIFEMIRSLGAELPGILSITPDAPIQFEHQAYKPLSLDQLSLRILERNFKKPLLLSNSHGRLSLAGAQDKLCVRYDERRGLFYDTLNQSPSTHIAKPDARSKRYQPSAINEYLCMKLAHEMKLPVPPVWFINSPQSVYLVRRFDRLVNEQHIVCLHQFDACQLLGVGPNYKYQRIGSLVSLPHIVKALRELHLNGKDLFNFQRWVMFNYLIGNSEAHAKNISVFISTSGFALTPFYDLLCLQVHGNNQLALNIGNEYNFDSIGAHSWEKFCDDCGFGLKPTFANFRKMAQDLPKAWHSLSNKAIKQLPLREEEIALIHSMTDVFQKNCSAAISMTRQLSPE